MQTTPQFRLPQETQVCLIHVADGDEKLWPSSRHTQGAGNIWQRWGRLSGRLQSGLASHTTAECTWLSVSHVMSDLTARNLVGMAIHQRMNIEVECDLFPSGTMFITSIREPESFFRSMFHYFYQKYANLKQVSQRPCGVQCWGMPFAKWMGSVEKGEFQYKFGVTPNEVLDVLDDVYDGETDWAFRAKNFQAFELGFDYEETDTSEFSITIGSQNDWLLQTISKVKSSRLIDTTSLSQSPSTFSRVWFCYGKYCACHGLCFSQKVEWCRPSTKRRCSQRIKFQF